MALPKVGVQVVVADMQKFTRDIGNVEKDIQKTQKAFVNFANASYALTGMSGLTNMLVDVGLGLTSLTGPIGIAIGAFGALQKIFQAIINPIKKAWENLKGFVTELAEKAWNGIKNFAKGIFDFLNPIPELFEMIQRTASIAFGVLVRDSIRAVWSEIQNLASGALEAASNFQLLELRLKGIIAKDLMEMPDITKTIFSPPTTEQRLALINYTDALSKLKDELDATTKAYWDSVQSSGEFSKESLELKLKMDGLTNQVAATQKEVNALTLTEDGLIKTTKILSGGTRAYSEVEAEAAAQAKELLKWISRLAIETPFSTEDVANVYTLARSYGIAGEEAQTLTQAVGNFTAGMGLSGVEMERIIVNFGQMIQQGKVTGRELTDLARGALVPTTRIFELIADEIGKTTAEVREMASTGELSVDQFMAAFVKMSNQDFPNAAKNMTRTFEGLKERIRDFAGTALGMFVLKPALDKFSGFFSDVIGGMLDDPKLWTALEGLGIALGKSMELLLNALFPEGAGDMGSKLVTLIETIRDLVYTFNTGDWDMIRENLLKLGIPEWVLDTAKNLHDTWLAIKSFFDENKGFLMSAVGDILAAMGVPLAGENGVKTFNNILTNLMDYLTNHKGQIISDIEILTRKVEDFFAIMRTGQPKYQMQQAQVGDNAADDVGGTSLGGNWEKIAQTIFEIKESLRLALPDLKTFAGLEWTALENLGKAIVNLATATGLLSTQESKDGVTGLQVVLAVITGITQGTADIINDIAWALDWLRQVVEKYGTGSITATIGAAFGEWKGSEDSPAANYAGMLEQAWWDGEKWINPETGQIVTQVKKFKNAVEDQFRDMKREVVGNSIVPDMLGAIQSQFASTFSLSGLSYKSVDDFVRAVLKRFDEMKNEMTGNSIIPDMMEEIDESMVGGFRDTFRQSKKMTDQFTAAMQTSADYASGIPFSSGNTYNYNWNFQANYAKTQSPVTLKYDIEALLSAAAR